MPTRSSSSAGASAAVPHQLEILAFGLIAQLQPITLIDMKVLLCSIAVLFSLVCSATAQWADGTTKLTDTFNSGRDASATASTLPGSGAHLLEVKYCPPPAPYNSVTVSLGWNGTQYEQVDGQNRKRFRTLHTSKADYWWLESSADGGTTWTNLASGTY